MRSGGSYVNAQQARGGDSLAESDLMTNAGLGLLDYAAIALYLVATFGIALWFGHKQKDTEDFFVGGRRMPWLAVGLSILATLFSTISYLGTPGEVIKHGIGIFLGYLAIPLNFLVIMYLLVPFFMRLKLTSAYEYLEHRFSYSVRATGALLFIGLRLGWMSMVIFVASMALDRIKGADSTLLYGPDLYWWIGAIGLVAAVYTSIGGIQAVIWVDVLQCILLLAGVLLAIGYVALADGTGPAQWWSTASNVAAAAGTRHTAPQVFSWDLTVRVTIVTAIINNFFWTICTHGSDQVVLQRYFATSSLQSARRSYLTTLVVDLTMATLLSIAGLALLSFYISHANLLPAGESPLKFADKLFPYFLGSQLPAGCAGLIVSAFLCDAIQTLESGANGITAVVVKDFMTPTRKEHGEVRPDLRAAAETRASTLSTARILAFIISLIVAGNACLVAYVQERLGLTIFDMMPRFFNMFIGPLAAMFFAGMFLPRCTTRSILPAALVGLVLAIIWSWWDGIAAVWPLWASILGVTSEGQFQKPTFLLAIAVPCVTTLVLAWLLSLIVDRSGKQPGSNYTWWAIVRDGKPQ
jgi:SSS family solute:Na+ symporter